MKTINNNNNKNHIKKPINLNQFRHRRCYIPTQFWNWVEKELSSVTFVNMFVPTDMLTGLYNFFTELISIGQFRLWAQDFYYVIGIAYHYVIFCSTHFMELSPRLYQAE